MKHRSEKLSDDEKNLAAGKKLMFEEEGSSIKFTEKIFFWGHKMDLARITLSTFAPFNFFLCV